MTDSAPRVALLLVDIQYSFLPPNGSLAVTNGLDILPPVNHLLDSANLNLIIASQDFHPPSHISFASRHAKPPFTSLQLTHSDGHTIEQELWPDHCVQGTRGCEIEEGVQGRLDRLGAGGGKVNVVRKGTEVDRDAYSAFATLDPNSGGQTSVVEQLLLEHHITHLLITGLATDYCVRASTLSALSCPQWRGTVLVVRDAVRGVDPVQSEKVLLELEEAGAKVVEMEGEEVRAFLRGSR